MDYFLVFGAKWRWSQRSPEDQTVMAEHEHRNAKNEAA
jgi:hypothetical protein